MLIEAKPTQKKYIKFKICAKVSQYYHYNKWLCRSWSTKRDCDKSVKYSFKLL